MPVLAIQIRQPAVVQRRVLFGQVFELIGQSFLVILDACFQVLSGKVDVALRLKTRVDAIIVLVVLCLRLHLLGDVQSTQRVVMVEEPIDILIGSEVVILQITVLPRHPLQTAHDSYQFEGVVLVEEVGDGEGQRDTLAFLVAQRTGFLVEGFGLLHHSDGGTYLQSFPVPDVYRIVYLERIVLGAKPEPDNRAQQQSY